jgi:hypothetical protein
MDGLLEPGNIDLNNRPQVRNPDGSVSTVRSSSFNFGGREVLLPTVSDDGRLLSDDEAVDLYRRSGRHLGHFSTPDAADAYAQQLHLDQERQYVGTEHPMSGSQADAAAESPSGLIARARGMVQASGRPLNAENLNRAMMVMRGAPDEGYVDNVAESGATGRSNTPRRPLPMPPPGLPPQSQDVMQDMPQLPTSPSPGGARSPVMPSLPQMDPRTGVDDQQLELSNARPGIGTPQSSPPGTANAATIAQGRGAPRQSTPPAGGAVTGPGAGGPGSATPSSGNVPVNRADLTPAELQQLDTNPQFIDGKYDQMLGQIMSGLLRRPGASGLRLPGGPVPGGGSAPMPGGAQSVPDAGVPLSSVDRMVPPAVRTYNPPPAIAPPGPPALPPGASPPPSLPPGPPVAPMLPGGGGPANPMLAAPPVTPRVSGPPARPQIGSDRGSTGRSQDTRAARDQALSQELRNRNRQRYGAPDSRE